MALLLRVQPTAATDCPEGSETETQVKLRIAALVVVLRISGQSLGCPVQILDVVQDSHVQGLRPVLSKCRQDLLSRMSVMFGAGCASGVGNQIRNNGKDASEQIIPNSSSWDPEMT
ncbi:hypothetical protein DdX_13457 [Ditylenchus destructor]|uniref:Uncharacterized protein n=1 Tax=Ditylenchus destructor TaxID=166010 RepID=A0AAD4R2T1_9BILA|nr:hypothetical protein DdX_13457 [Ditylenchus destructor]